LRPLDDWGAAPAELDEADVELLARLEHERWCAARIAAGWGRGARDDAARRHPDLVSWDELGERSRELNRLFARALPRLLVRAGFQVVRGGSRIARDLAPSGVRA
ncbi:MAG: hypothetical protein QOK40_1136, partial [Miltoncostaeaceae bacterium]|nr:hypothetical protein [Miltoncostaeaceae bacterium]